MKGDLQGGGVERRRGPRAVQYLMVKRNGQVHVKETKKENLARCQKNMVSLELIGNWIQGGNEQL